jgi:DnaJ-class molecular chaperone
MIMEQESGVWKIEPKSVGKEQTRSSLQKGTGKKDGKDKRFHPQKYGMAACPLCDGTGRLINKPGGLEEVCLKCGGFGHIKKGN